MLSIIGGILLVIAGLIFAFGGIRAWPPGRYRPLYQRESSLGEIIIALGVGIGLVVLGVWLLL